MINVSWIVDYEAGDLDHDEIVDGFQKMIDDGSVWQLQGSYGHTATHLIEAGLCTPQQQTRDQQRRDARVRNYNREDG